MQNKNMKDMEVDKDSENKEDFNCCTKCNYKCKKENILKKHMILKHEDHQCKQCPKKLPTSFELLLHVSKHHCETVVKTSDLVEQEEAWNIKFQSTLKSTKEEDELFDDMLLKGLEETGEFKKDSNFVFRGSMLDEFQDINEN